MLPTLVVVGGTHGAGKSTLASQLATRLGWMLVSRDLVRGGMAWTEAEVEHVAAGDLSKRAVSTFYEATELMLLRGGSVVIESAFRRGISESDLLPLLNFSRMRYVQCTVPRELAIERCRSRAGREYIGDMLDGRDEERWLRVEQPLDLGVDPLVVDTTDGYDPGLEAIESFVRSRDT